MEFLLFVIAVLLFLILNTLKGLTALDERGTPFLKSIFSDIFTDPERPYKGSFIEILKNQRDWLQKISNNTNTITNVLIADQPAGELSAEIRMRENLVKVRSKQLIKDEGLSEKEANLRAELEVYDVYRYDLEKLVSDINGNSWRAGVINEKVERAEENYYSSGMLEKDIERKYWDKKENKWKIISHDLMAPLYYLIKKIGAEKGDKVALEYDSTSLTGYFYEIVEPRAVIKALIDKKILGWHGKPDWKDPKLVLLISDIEKIKTIVYEGGTSHDDRHFEERWAEGKLPQFLDRGFF